MYKENKKKLMNAKKNWKKNQSILSNTQIFINNKNIYIFFRLHDRTNKKKSERTRCVNWLVEEVQSIDVAHDD